MIVFYLKLLMHKNNVLSRVVRVLIVDLTTNFIVIITRLQLNNKIT